MHLVLQNVSQAATLHDLQVRTAIAQRRRNAQFSLLTNAHAYQTLVPSIMRSSTLLFTHLVPSLDNLARAEVELERLITIEARVEFRAVRRQRALNSGAAHVSHHRNKPARTV